MQLTRELLQTINSIAIAAGQQILSVYERPGALDVNVKADDSPITEADMRAHHLIVNALTRLTPDLPVLSEESADVPFEVRQMWQRYWLVDPLDGTKEFISRNGEFTVNIALVRAGMPVLGVVHVPVTRVSYLGFCEDDHQQAWRCDSNGQWQDISAAHIALPGSTHSELRVVASRRHGGGALDKFLVELNQRYAGLTLVNMGSSLKICLIAEGLADIYPRLAPTSEWDTAAAHAVLRAAGGEIYKVDLHALTYNQKDSLLNPSFVAVGKAEDGVLSFIAAALAGIG